MSKNTTKVFVTNITQDKIVKYFDDIYLHHIRCDRRIEGMNTKEEQAYMICSNTEYASIKKNGYYEVIDEE